MSRESAFGWEHTDGRRAWFAHDCVDGLKMFLLGNEYSIIRNGTEAWITPSVRCLKCGFHSQVKIIENKEKNSGNE